MSLPLKARAFVLFAGVLLALIVGAGAVAAPRARAQSADPGQVAYGNEIAALLGAGDIDGILAHMSPTTVNCPEGETPQIWPVCEGHAGESAEGYWAAVFASDAVLTALDNVGAHIESYLTQLSVSPAFELFTISPTGWETGPTACAECFTFVLSTEADANRTSNGRPAPIAIMFQALRDDGAARIRSVTFGSALDPRGPLLTGGTVGEQQFILVRAGAQSADPGQVAYGNEIAALLRAGDIDGILARMSTTTETCPADESPFFRACEGHWGETAEGYWVGQLGSDAVFVDLDGVRARIDSALSAHFTDSAFDLFTVSPTGWQPGSFTCAECFTVVLSTETDADAPNEPLSRGSTAMVFEVLNEGGAQRIRSVASGGTAGDLISLLIGGMVGEQHFIFVRDHTTPKPPVVGGGLARGDGGGDASWIAGAAAVLVVTASAFAARR